MSIKDWIPWKWGRKDEDKEREESTALSTLQYDVNRVFDDFYKRMEHGFRLAPFGNGFGGNGLSPKVDVSESDDEVEITADLPDWNEDEIELSLFQDSLRIQGRKSSEREEKKKNFFLREREFGSFHREVPLPCSVDPEKANAEFKKGTLRIRLPRIADDKSVRKIEIRQSA